MRRAICLLTAAALAIQATSAAAFPLPSLGEVRRGLEGSASILPAPNHAADRMIEMVDGTGTTTWDYWDDGQVKEMASPQGTVLYDYYATTGRLQYLTEVISGGTNIVTTYTYDDAGRTETIDKFGETTTFEYDEASRPEKMIYDTGAYALYTYDGRSRIKAVEHKNSSNTLLRKETNVYDPASRITSRYEGPASGGVTTTFGYDDAGQLTSESSSGYSASYSYDANGNRTNRTVNGVSETYTVDDSDKLTSVTWSNGLVNYSKEYAYHYSGRPTSITYKTNGVTQATETMTWDKESRMLTNSLANASYVYNGFDARVSKTVSSTTTTFKRAGADPVSPLLSDVAGSTTTNYLPGISSRVGSTSTFSHSGIKNGILQTNSSQSNTATKRYDAFGNELSTSGTWQTRFDYGGGFGYQRDDESGYKLLGHRYYDPEIGRFLTRDPMKDGRNWYAYCANGPADATDPEGTWFWKLWDVVDVITDPGDPLNWIGLVDPTPTTRAIKIANRVKKLVKAANIVADSSKSTTKLKKIGKASKPGSAGPPGESKPFPRKMVNEMKEEHIKNKKSCTYCGTLEGPWHIDHIIPRSKGGNNTIHNAQCICWRCNLSKGNREAPKTLPPEGP